MYCATTTVRNGTVVLTCNKVLRMGVRTHCLIFIFFGFILLHFNGFVYKNSILGSFLYISSEMLFCEKGFYILILSDFVCPDELTLFLKSNLNLFKHGKAGR